MYVPEASFASDQSLLYNVGIATNILIGCTLAIMHRTIHICACITQQ